MTDHIPDAGKKVEELREALEEMVFQYAYAGVINDQLCLVDAGLSALECAFAALGWTSPHPIPERECMADGCHEEATCGTPTPDGYKRLCSECFTDLERGK